MSSSESDAWQGGEVLFCGGTDWALVRLDFPISIKCLNKTQLLGSLFRCPREASNPGRNLSKICVAAGERRGWQGEKDRTGEKGEELL